MIKLALAGNPNSGKTSLFNNLTGMKQHVGNWPGKTIEKISGKITHKGKYYELTDLPGTYSLTARSPEEIVARDYLIKEKDAIILNVVDASNLERNLYLTVQLLELGANVILALNMNKIASRHGMEIDEKKLQQLLGIPVLKFEANDKDSSKKLLEQIKVERIIANKITYGEELEEHIHQLECLLHDSKIPRWHAIKLIEQDRGIINKTEKDILEKSKKIIAHLKQVFAENTDAAMADARYGFISGLIRESVKRPKLDKQTRSEIIDKVTMNKYLGLPIFLIVMYLMFQLTFTLAAPLTDLLTSFFDYLAQLSATYLTSINAPAWLASFVADAIFGGIGSVIVFLPNISLLFLIISLLEDSGYMARAAFIMDRFMHKLGLHGKSFIPMILGFGCNVPAIMASRTLESKHDRILTILINPCMSCSARLPVYILFAGAFFTAYQGLVIFSIYLLGIVMAIIVALLFRKTILKGKSPGLVMELPSYKLPTITGTIIHVWQRTKQFLVKAGSLIFIFVILLWFLGNLPLGVTYGSEQSLIAIIGKIIAPIFAPLGFGNWQSVVALISGIFAKEIIVANFGAFLGVENLSSLFTPLSAYSFMVFTLLYIPCVPTLVTIKNELNTKWMLFAASYLFILAWFVSFIIYQLGSVLL